jgi:hypothetical protein
MSISIKRYLESKSTVLFEGCPVNEVNVPEKFHDVIPHSSSGQKLSERDLYFLIFEKLISSGKMIKTVTPDKVNKMEFKRFSFVLRNGKENKLIFHVSIVGAVAHLSQVEFDTRIAGVI